MRSYIGTKIIHAEPQERDGKPGYKVQYPDGYVSWSPDYAFEEAYRRCDQMNFGLALEALKKGHKVARRGWQDMHLYLNVTSEHTNTRIMIQMGNIYTHPGWTPSHRDMLADDWEIID